MEMVEDKWNKKARWYISENKGHLKYLYGNLQKYNHVKSYILFERRVWQEITSKTTKSCSYKQCY